MQMSLADLTRCHNEQEGRDPAATGLGSQRRVAYADESQEGINSLMNWASLSVSKPDDIELQVLVLIRFAMCIPAAPLDQLCSDHLVPVERQHMCSCCAENVCTSRDGCRSHSTIPASLRLCVYGPPRHTSIFVQACIL